MFQHHTEVLQNASFCVLTSGKKLSHFIITREWSENVFKLIVAPLWFLRYFSQ